MMLTELPKKNVKQCEGVIDHRNPAIKLAGKAIMPIKV